MKRPQLGMTLIELMIVVAVVAILAAIAYPSYRDHVRRSNRTDAKVALEERAQALEKCFTRSMDYTSAACATATAAGTSRHGHYLITVAPTATTFTITATPQGSQTDDTKCMALSLDEAGRRTVSGTGSVADCW